MLHSPYLIFIISIYICYLALACKSASIREFSKKGTRHNRLRRYAERVKVQLLPDPEHKDRSVKLNLVVDPLSPVYNSDGEIGYSSVEQQDRRKSASTPRTARSEPKQIPLSRKSAEVNSRPFPEYNGKSEYYSDGSNAGRSTPYGEALSYRSALEADLLSSFPLPNMLPAVEPEKSAQEVDDSSTEQDSVGEYEDPLSERTSRPSLVYNNGLDIDDDYCEEEPRPKFSERYPYKLHTVPLNREYAEVIGTEIVDAPPYYVTGDDKGSKFYAKTVMNSVVREQKAVLLNKSNVLPPEKLGQGMLFSKLQVIEPLNMCRNLILPENFDDEQMLRQDAHCLRLFASGVLNQIQFLKGYVDTDLSSTEPVSYNTSCSEEELLLIEHLLFQKFPRVVLIVGNRNWFMRVSRYVINWNENLVSIDTNMFFQDLYKTLFRGSSKTSFGSRLSIRNGLLKATQSFMNRRPKLLQKLLVFLVNRYTNPFLSNFYDVPAITPFSSTWEKVYNFKLYIKERAQRRLFRYLIDRVLRPVLHMVIEEVKYKLVDFQIGEIVDLKKIIDSTFKLISVNQLPENFVALMRNGIRQYADHCGPVIKKNVFEQVLRLPGDHVNERTLLFTLINSGGVFIQTLFQMLTRYMDNREIERDFGQLFDHINPLDVSVAQQIVSSDFADFRDQQISTPYLGLMLGSASVAQVHLATWYHKGYDQHVVVKVKRPNLNAVARQELLLFRKIAKDVPTLAPIVDDVMAVLVNEMNFADEANFWKLGQEHYDSPQKGIYVPECFKHTKDVLVLGRAHGRTLASWLQSPELSVNVTSILSQRLVTLLKIWFEEAIFGSGFFHSDLHPGNILFEHNEDRPLESALSIIDFGQSAILSTVDQSFLQTLALGIQLRSERLILQSIDPYMVDLPESHKTQLRKDLSSRLNNFQSKDSQSITKLSTDITNVFSLYGLHFPAQIIFFYRARILIERSVLDLRERLLVHEIEIPEPEDVYRAVAVTKTQAIMLALSHITDAINAPMRKLFITRLQSTPLIFWKFSKLVTSDVSRTLKSSFTFLLRGTTTLSERKRDFFRDLQDCAVPLTLNTVLHHILDQGKTYPLIHVNPIDRSMLRYKFGSLDERVFDSLFYRYKPAIQEMWSDNAHRLESSKTIPVSFTDRLDVFEAPATGDLVFYLDGVLYAIQDSHMNVYYYSATGRKMLFYYDQRQLLADFSPHMAGYVNEKLYPVTAPVNDENAITSVFREDLDGYYDQSIHDSRTSEQLLEDLMTRENAKIQAAKDRQLERIRAAKEKEEMQRAAERELEAKEKEAEEQERLSEEMLKHRAHEQKLARESAESEFRRNCGTSLPVRVNYNSRFSTVGSFESRMRVLRRKIRNKLLNDNKPDEDPEEDRLAPGNMNDDFPYIFDCDLDEDSASSKSEPASVCKPEEVPMRKITQHYSDSSINSYEDSPIRRAFTPLGFSNDEYRKYGLNTRPSLNERSVRSRLKERHAIEDACRIVESYHRVNFVRDEPPIEPEEVTHSDSSEEATSEVVKEMEKPHLRSFSAQDLKSDLTKGKAGLGFCEEDTGDSRDLPKTKLRLGLTTNLKSSAFSKKTRNTRYRALMRLSALAEGISASKREREMDEARADASGTLLKDILESTRSLVPFMTRIKNLFLKDDQGQGALKPDEADILSCLESFPDEYRSSAAEVLGLGGTDDLSSTMSAFEDSPNYILEGLNKALPELLELDIDAEKEKLVLNFDTPDKSESLWNPYLKKQMPLHLYSQGVNSHDLARAFVENLPRTLRPHTEPAVNSDAVMDDLNKDYLCVETAEGRKLVGKPFSAARFAYGLAGVERRRLDWPIGTYPERNFYTGVHRTGADYGSLPNNFLSGKDHATDLEDAAKACMWIFPRDIKV